MNKRFLNCVTLGLASQLVCCCAEAPNDADVGRTASAIVGGSEAWLNSAVALTTTQCDPAGDNPLICSALLISPTVVLTAAHCVSLAINTSACPSGIDPTKWQTFSVAVGCHDVVSGCPAANWKPLAYAPVIYPGNDHDIAILHLAAPVTQKPTRLASPARLAEIAAGDNVTLYGWGYTAENGPASPVLQSITRPIASIPLDRLGLPAIKEQMFDTVNGTNPYVGTNHGDSGGPSLVFRDGEWFSLGVIQAGAYDSAGTDLGLVPYYFSWILSQASDFPPQSLLPSAQILSILG